MSFGINWTGVCETKTNHPTSVPNFTNAAMAECSQALSAIILSCKVVLLFTRKMPLILKKCWLSRCLQTFGHKVYVNRPCLLESCWLAVGPIGMVTQLLAHLLIQASGYPLQVMGNVTVGPVSVTQTMTELPVNVLPLRMSAEQETSVYAVTMGTVNVIDAYAIIISKASSALRRCIRALSMGKHSNTKTPRTFCSCCLYTD